MVQKSLRHFQLHQKFSYLDSKITESLPISTFAPLVGIDLEIPSSLIELKICAIDVRINN